MATMTMLILAYGKLDWSFPWWVWGAGLIFDNCTGIFLAQLAAIRKGNGS